MHVIPVWAISLKMVPNNWSIDKQEKQEKIGVQLWRLWFTRDGRVEWTCSKKSEKLFITLNLRELFWRVVLFKSMGLISAWNYSLNFLVPFCNTLHPASCCQTLCSFKMRLVVLNACRDLLDISSQEGLPSFFDLEVGNPLFHLFTFNCLLTFWKRDFFVLHRVHQTYAVDS